MSMPMPDPDRLILTHLLRDAVSAHANRPALRYEGRVWTYAEFNAQVANAAALLQSLGAGPGTRIGLCLPNTPYSAIFYYAILTIGGVVVNYNPLYTPAELRKQIQDSHTTLMVLPDLAAIYDKLPPLLGQTRLVRLVVCPMAGVLPRLKAVALPLVHKGVLARPAWSDAIVRYRPGRAYGLPVPAPLTSQTLAVLQYTGGTTGVPKGAMLTHANLAVNALQIAAHMPSLRPGQERLMGVLPFFHVFAMTAVLNTGIAIGAELQLHTRFQIDKIMRAIPRDRPTVLHAVPTIYAAIANAAEKSRVDISSIRVCISGGAPLPEEIRLRFERLTGARLVEGYGLTEAAPLVTCNPPDGVVRPRSVGVPAAWTVVEIRALDPPHAPLPPGRHGEICVRGPQVMAGYLDRPDDTAAVFIDGALRTGDIGYLDDDNYLFVTDRIKDVIICGGYNVYPRVIEEALYEHAAVAEAVVVGAPDAYRGETPVAFVTLRPGSTATITDLAAHLRELLSPIEQPGRIEIRAELPKTAVGKLSRKELRQELLTKSEQAA